VVVKHKPARKAKVDLVHRHPVHKPLAVLPQGYKHFNWRKHKYYFHQGHYYWNVHVQKRFVATHPPRGLVVKSIPEDYEIEECDNREVLVCNGIVFEANESGEEIVYRVIE